MERKLRLTIIIQDTIKRKYFLFFISYVFFFCDLNPPPLSDQCVYPPFGHPSSNGVFRGIGFPPALREFRFESLTLHPSQWGNCYVFTKISLHAEVLSIKRPRKYHRISVSVNLHVLFIYMFYLVCYKAKDKFHLKCERMSRLNLCT